MRHSSFLALAISLLAASAHANPGDLSAREVDLELVLAADASGSVSPELLAAQRAGFANAFRHPDLQAALSSGPLGTVAVVYFEWAGLTEQRQVVPWTLLSGPDEIEAFADRLETAPAVAPGGSTSISGALLYARHLISSNAYDGLRTVIDIASNGPNSDGPPVADAMQELHKSGVTVNALILPGPDFETTGPYATLFVGHVGPLDDYFRAEVIGGPGAFAIETDPEAGFAEAILRKLVLEVAWSM